MYRIDDNQNVANLPAPPTDYIGSQGYFTGGNPAATPPVPATRVRFWWLNLVQESLMALLSATGLAPSKSDSTLVLQAVSIIGRRTASYTAAGSSVFTVPAGVYSLDVLIRGAGAAGGYNSTYASGGGGSGGWSTKRVAVTPGQTFNLTVAAGGVCSPTIPGNGGNGNVTSFGTIFSATGGGGGGGGSSVSNPGGPGGMGIGGDYNGSGEFGTDGTQLSASPSGCIGGRGGGPGSGRGATGFNTGVSAIGGGGGGGGGGAAIGGPGGAGGSGAPGEIIIRF